MSKIKTPEEWMGMNNSQIDSETKYWVMQMKSYHEYASKLEMEEKIKEVENLIDTEDMPSVRLIIQAVVEKTIEILKK